MKRILLVPIGMFVFGAALALTASARPQAPAKPKPAAATTDSGAGKTLGSKNAPITIEVFSDFQCPACRAFYEGTLKQVIDNYVNTGKVYLVHRDFPLDMHPYSHQAARLANAAAQVGQFETMERALFDKQDVWSPTGKIEEAVAPSFSAPTMKRIHDIATQKANELNVSIDRDRALGVQKNVNQTPSIYVTARGKTEPLPGGGVSYTLMKQYLDYLLRQ